MEWKNTRLKQKRQNVCTRVSQCLGHWRPPDENLDSLYSTFLFKFFVGFSVSFGEEESLIRRWKLKQHWFVWFHGEAMRLKFMANFSLPSSDARDEGKIEKLTASSFALLWWAAREAGQLEISCQADDHHDHDAREEFLRKFTESTYTTVKFNSKEEEQRERKVAKNHPRESSRE